MFYTICNNEVSLLLIEVVSKYVSFSPQMEAFVTLATSDSYATGALVLGHSIR